MATNAISAARAVNTTNSNEGTLAGAFITLAGRFLFSATFILSDFSTSLRKTSLILSARHRLRCECRLAGPSIPGSGLWNTGTARRTQHSAWV
jgi:hypothetical protein